MVTKFLNSYLSIILLFAACFDGYSQQPNPPGQIENNGKAVNEVYLFAHMTHKDYGKLYYSVSLDGLHWNSLIIKTGF
tara:strand:- start:898 stop:1131 length:234 start_codon:yes stop_codon:yes gene_type:complete